MPIGEDKLQEFSLIEIDRKPSCRTLAKYNAKNKKSMTKHILIITIILHSQQYSLVINYSPLRYVICTLLILPNSAHDDRIIDENSPLPPLRH